MTATGARPLVRRHVEAGVATLTLDSPHNRNALSTTLVDQLMAALTSTVDDPGVRVIVLSHEGPAFCSGADLAETAAAFEREGTMPVSRLGELLVALWESPKPVVARVAGPTRAGGLGLVAAADLAVCTTAATFAASEVRLGVIPAVISAVVLPRLTPRAAAELFLTGDPIDGVRAAATGLVTAAVPADQLDATVDRYVRSVIRGAPAALAGAKTLLRQPDAVQLRAELDELSRLSATFFTSAEGREGVRSFLEKRAPSWILS